MALENAVSKYYRYKEDTDILANWLALTAKKLGYPSNLLARSEPSRTGSSRVKGT
jgi:hypothetical protein